MTPSGVKKKLKAKNFAAAVNREEITHGAEMLDLLLDDHIQHVITALQTVAAPLGFAPDVPGTGSK
jgi:predicted hydrolase (HD superfamily)